MCNFLCKLAMMTSYHRIRFFDAKQCVKSVNHLVPLSSVYSGTLSAIKATGCLVSTQKTHQSVPQAFQFQTEPS